jgi:hypothetical protein
MDWSRIQPGLISPDTRVRIPLPLRGSPRWGSQLESPTGPQTGSPRGSGPGVSRTRSSTGRAPPLSRLGDRDTRRVRQPLIRAKRVETQVRTLSCHEGGRTWRSRNREVHRPHEGLAPGGGQQACPLGVNIGVVQWKNGRLQSGSQGFDSSHRCRGFRGPDLPRRPCDRTRRRRS